MRSRYQRKCTRIVPLIATLGGTSRSLQWDVYSDYQICRKALNAPVTHARSGRRGVASSRAGWGWPLTSCHTLPGASQHPNSGCQGTPKFGQLDQAPPKLREGWGVVSAM
jgi:hypothetical protein